MTASLFHFTVLSNFARGYDKYSNSYCKSRIPESSFADRFFLLRQNEMAIGIQKASLLLHKLALAGNRLIALRTEVEDSQLRPNTTNGRGQFIQSDRVTLTGLYDVSQGDGSEFQLLPLAVEDAMASSLRLLNPELLPFSKIRPRAVSFLPVALACQAKCPFCFSKASVSSEQSPAKPDWVKINAWLRKADARGAERAVITGGGEPTLLGEEPLRQLIAACSAVFKKVVLITNGHTLSAATVDQKARLAGLYHAGLRVLSVSRHHHDMLQNEQLMCLATPAETLIRAWREERRQWPELRLRLICVLQKGGVEDAETLEAYVTWAAKLGVEEICFKELYVSTSAESVYHDRSANEWSRRHQAPLSLVTQFAEREGFTVASRLPWGVPVYLGQRHGRQLQIAAYTEPSLFWERTQGIARSWNVMADGGCHVSLEDRASKIELEQVS